MPLSILVVDDEAGIRESLAQFLEDYDYDVTTAESAEDALELLERSVFDIVIVDMRLPGMSGDYLIVKANEKHPDLRFLIHTGSVDYRLPDELIRIGVKPGHIFLKPLTDMSVVVESIRELLGDKE